MIKEEVSYSIIFKPKIESTNTVISDIPIEIKNMLLDSQDIVVDDFPNVLPPKRSINHHIDLIPGESLPNKAAYRMIPKENEEVRN